MQNVVHFSAIGRIFYADSVENKSVTFCNSVCSINRHGCPFYCRYIGNWRTYLGFLWKNWLHHLPFESLTCENFGRLNRGIHWWYSQYGDKPLSAFQPGRASRQF